MEFSWQNTITFWQIAGLLVAGSLIGGCDNSIAPIDTEIGIFAIYGVLDLNEQTNYIRVRDMNAPFTAEATREIDAAVSLQNLEQGLSAILESQRKEYGGIYLHNFMYKNEVIPDTEYRLTVERSDGATVDMTTITPTKPAPHVAPLNQNCYVPIDFELSPLNGSTVVLQVGLPDIEDKYTWGRSHILKPDDHQSPGKIIFTFTPHEQVNEILPGTNSVRRCGDHLHDGNIYLSYIHYGLGFYERVSEDPFDIFGSAQRFGALYYDTLAIPVDTSPVCPQDC